MLETINEVLSKIDGIVWGVPLMVLILSGGLYLTIRMGFLQTRKLPLALKWMVKNEEDGHGEVTSFGALCTALSATIGTGNIVESQRRFVQEDREHYSGWRLQHSLEWRLNMQRVFWQ